MSVAQWVRKKTVNFVLKSTVWISVCLGLLPLRHNARTKRLELSNSVLLYNVCINLLTISLISFTLPTDARNMEIEFFTKKPLNGLINTVHVSLSIVTLIVVLVKNWTGRRSVQMVFNELLALQQEYFNSSTTHDWDCARFDYYLLSKAAITLAQSLSMIYTLCGVTSSPSISFLIMILMVIVLQNVLFFVEMHYFIAVLHIYRYFWLLHQQFECVRHRRNQPSARNVTADGIQNCLHPAKSLVEEFNRMIDIYIRLMYVSAKLSRLYEQQLLMLIGSFVSANVQSLFYICVFFSGKVVEVTFENFFYFAQGFIVNVIDFWINITVCEHTLRTANETLSFLQIFGEYTNLDREEAQSLEMFSILCCSHTLDFRICDFFELNHSTGHRVLMTAILYLLFLVQFDYMNL